MRGWRGSCSSAWGDACGGGGAALNIRQEDSHLRSGSPLTKKKEKKISRTEKNSTAVDAQMIEMGGGVSRFSFRCARRAQVKLLGASARGA